MIQRNNDLFEPKDSIKLGLTYLVGIQFVLPLVFSLILSIVGRDLLLSDPAALTQKYNVLLQFLVFSLGAIWLVWRYYPHLEKAYYKFRVNFLDNMKLIFKYYFIAQFLNILINLLLEFGFNLSASSDNQQMVESLLESVPLLMATVTIIYAPIIEEIVFRGGLYLGLRNVIGEMSASILSAVLFGAIHIIPQVIAGGLIDLLYILPYTLLGYFMVKAVRETESLFGGIIFHGLNNLIATLMVMLIV